MAEANSTQNEVTYHQADECDYEGISALCEPHGWNTSPQDAKYLCSFLPSAARVARSGGKTVGLCLGVPWNDNEAFIGLMVIDEDLRGKGIGRKLLEESLEAMGDRNISLYASPQGVPFYRKYGFSSEEIPTYLYQTKFIPKKEPLKGASFAQADNIKIVPLSEVSTKDLMDYDTDVHRIRREDWITPVVGLPDSVAAVNDSNQIVGYAGIGHYPDEKYTQIKPLLADSPTVAAMLLQHVLEVVPDGYRVKVKVPSENPDAMSLMEKIGFSTEIKQPDMIMFNKYKFQVKINKVYSVLNGWNQFA